MLVIRDTLDDALLDIYPELLKAAPVNASRGANAEIVGALIEIKKPRARLSRTETRGKLFSSVGELFWYLSKNNQLDFIERYVSRYREESEDGKTVYGGYGPRLFAQRGVNQFANVQTLLRERPTSRRAVMQIFSAEDIAAEHREIPCTTTLQFMIRNDNLDMITTMRSNDAYWGLPHDVFCFTMLQEIMARSLGIELGSYRHFVSSLHLYDEHRVLAEDFLNEGFQTRVEMPEMPTGDPWRSINAVLQAESEIRRGQVVKADQFQLEEYWRDFIRIIQVHFAKANGEDINSIANEMSFNRYRPYILGRSKKQKNELAHTSE